MQVYKGFNRELKCTCGQGVYAYEPGKTYKETKSKTRSAGFHCAEYLPDCFKFYAPDGNNRFFLVEAGGSIDEEEEDSKIACTEITLVKELNLKQMVIACMIYMVKHPQRSWKASGYCYKIDTDKAETGRGIAIARGKNPRARGGTGSAIGLVLEKNGQIIEARAFEVDGKQILPDTWYTITKEGEIYEIQDNRRNSGQKTKKKPA